MTSTARLTRPAVHPPIAGRIVRNLIVTLAVTAIFGFKAADPNARGIDPELMTLAQR